MILFIGHWDSYAQFVAPGYTIKNFTIEDGLPVKSVNNIIQAENGYLWLSTNGGLVRFDGVDFKVYTSAEYPGLRGNRILGIVEANDGSIIAMNQGADIFAFKDETFTFLLSSDQGVVGEARDRNFYYKDKEGRIWLGDETGIKIYDNGSLSSFVPELIQKPVARILKAEQGVVWFSYFQDKFLYRYEDGVVEKILDHHISPTDSRKGNLRFPIRSGISLPDNTSDGIQFIVTHFEIYSYVDNELTLLYESNGEAFLNAATTSNNTLLLVAALPFQSFKNLALFEFKEGTLVKKALQPPSFIEVLRDSPESESSIGIYIDNQLIMETDGFMNGLLVDKEGTLWIPTIQEGLLQLRENLFNTITEADGLSYDNVNAVFQSSDSSIWVGTFGRGVSRISVDETISNYSIQSNLDEGYLYTIEQLADQTLLAGGLLKMRYLNTQTNTFELYPVPEVISDFSVHSMFEDSQQRLWVGTSARGNRGLFVREDGAWENLTANENVPYATYQYIMETPGGDIWASARGEGLVRYDGNSFFHYSTKDGFTSDFIRGLYVYVDPETGAEWLFVGSEGDGLDIIRLVDGAPDFSSLVTLNQTNGVYDNSIHVILEDDFGRFWMNTNQGIFWITKEEVHAFLDGEIETISSTSYTEKDGLAHREGNGGTQPSAIKAFDGTLWFAGQGGAVSVDPANITQNLTAPPVHIQRIAWGDKEIQNIGTEIALEADERDFEVSFAALSFIHPEKNQYRYKLDGFHDHNEDEWHYIGNRRTAYFTNVPSGTYTFIVQGSNNDGLWSTEAASIKITIAPFFYETAWFKLLAGASVLGLLVLVLVMREYRSRVNQQKLEGIITEKTNDLRKEKEEVERQKEIIDELSHAKDTFFTNISHELRTPLTLVLGPLESLSYDTSNVPENWARNLDLARRNGFRLKQLVDQVLDLTRIESNKMEIHPIKLDVSAKVRLIVSSFESLALSNKISLKPSIPDEEIYAGVDPDVFQKILNNLISNAIKFTPEQGTVEVSVELNSGFVELSVSDNGIGIEKERLPYIFDRFHSQEGSLSKRSYGLGVGLNLAKELAELHGGTISVESEYGTGTTFLVTLRSYSNTMARNGAPVSGDEIVDENMLSYNIGLPEAPILQKTGVLTTNILLVEDNPDMRQYISGLLSGDQIKVTEAVNGVEGKKKLALIEPDVIITDVMMPDMDGHEFSRYVRSIPELRLTPIMMLTALEDLDNRMEAFEIGVSDYLTKPFVEKELKARIGNLLRLKAERDQARTKQPSEEPEELSEGTAFVKKLQEYIIEHIAKPKIPVEELSELVNMSRGQLYRNLKTETGFTPAEFVREIRLLKGHQILKNKQMRRISDVAYAIGFSSPGYFTSVFEKRFGISPRLLIQA